MTNSKDETSAMERASAELLADPMLKLWHLLDAARTEWMASDEPCDEKTALARAVLAAGWRPPLPDSETESKWRVAYEQKLADFARETLRTSELTREVEELRRQLADRETPAEDRYPEGTQVEIYAGGRWEPADICRDYGGDRVEARDWGRTMHTCRREDVRRREVTS